MKRITRIALTLIFFGSSGTSFASDNLTVGKAPWSTLTKNNASILTSDTSYEVKLYTEINGQDCGIRVGEKVNRDIVDGINYFFVDAEYNCTENADVFNMYAFKIDDNNKKITFTSSFGFISPLYNAKMEPNQVGLTNDYTATNNLATLELSEGKYHSIQYTGSLVKDGPLTSSFISVGQAINTASFKLAAGTINSNPIKIKIRKKLF